MISVIAVIASPQIVWGSNNSIEELNNRLFSAVFNNNFALVRSAMNAGANPKATNEEGLTAAGLAVEKGYFNIAHYILGILKQTSSAKKNNTLTILEELNKNRTDPSTTMVNSNKIQIPTPIPAPKVPITLEPRTYQKWPKNVPNPFAPSTQYNKLIPIIGTVKNPSVKPTTQDQTINLKSKMQNENSASMKTPDGSILSVIKAPTLLLPFGKQTPKKIKSKKTSDLKTGKAKTYKEEFIEFEEEDFFDKIWNKVNKIF
jgi:hypothetical protein